MPEINSEKETEIKEFISKYLKRTNVMTDFGGINPAKDGFDQRWAGNKSNGKQMQLCDIDFKNIREAIDGVILRLTELRDSL